MRLVFILFYGPDFRPEPWCCIMAEVVRPGKTSTSACVSVLKGRR